MSVWNKIGNSTWTKINSIFTKTGSSTWTEIVGVWVKTASSTWTRVFTRLLLPANTVLPEISGSTYLYATLTGTLGTWTSPNGTNSYARQWQSAPNNNGTPGSFSNISGATSSTYTTTISENGRWVRLRVTATNLSGSSIAYSYEVLITKYSPVALTIPVISGSASVNNTLTALTTVGTYWKNTTTNSGDTAPDSFSYRWFWGDTGQNRGSDSSTYLIGNDDIGHTLRVEVTATNTGGSASSTSNATSTVGQALSITGVTFKDNNGNTGFNNRQNLTTASPTFLHWIVTGVDTSTTFRVRYRVYNNQTGAYWNPDTQATATASAAWLSYTDNYYGTGTISSVSISGSTATIYDLFYIPDIFNGSTYSGGLSRWTWEYELSVVDGGGTRYYWTYPDGMSTSSSYDWYDIDPTSSPTINPTSTTVDTSTAVNFSGTLNSYPSSLTSYPYAYRITYGNGSNSGWINFSYGQSNPTYSLSYTYPSTGDYTAYVETIPYYTVAYSSIKVFNPVTRTLSFDANGGTGAPSAQTGQDNGSGATITISSTTPTRTNYTFDGWNTNSSGTGTNYSAGGSITLTSDVTLYAKWSAAATAPATPTGFTHTKTYSYNSDLSTTLTRITSSQKRQDWSYSATVSYGLSWNSVSGATSYEVGYNITTSPPANATWTGLTSTSKTDSWTQFSRGTVTYYYFVRARNSAGVSAWSSATGGASTATSVTGLSITLVNNSSGNTSSASPGNTAVTYLWTGVVSAQHYARISATIAGSPTGVVRSSGTV